MCVCVWLSLPTAFKVCVCIGVLFCIRVCLYEGAGALGRELQTGVSFWSLCNSPINLHT